MPIGGKLVLKGGVSLKGSVKKAKHKKVKQAAAAAADSEEHEQHKQQQDGEAGAPAPGVLLARLCVLFAGWMHAVCCNQQSLGDPARRQDSVVVRTPAAAAERAMCMGQFCCSRCTHKSGCTAVYL
jgi:hypothetical protein